MKHSSGLDNALSVHNLCKTYKNGREALKNVSFNVKEGDFYALLGRNGAGKSTTIGISCSLVNKSSGKVYVFGTDIDRDFQSAKSNIGLVPQEINFSQFETPWNIVINHAGYYGVKRSLAEKQAEKYLSVLGLWSYRHTMSRKLSGGMKRRLMIARALMHEPRLLILDEPTAGIDFEARLLMWDYMEKINREGITIILTTHYLEEAERLCRHVGVIELGEIILDIDMKSLFKHLQQETYVLHIQQPINELPDVTTQSMRLRDERTIEVDIPKGSQINPLFEKLAQTGIDVVSIQNKSNRLETLFMELLKTEATTLQSEESRE